MKWNVKEEGVNPDFIKYKRDDRQYYSFSSG